MLQQSPTAFIEEQEAIMIDFTADCSPMAKQQ